MDSTDKPVHGTMASVGAMSEPYVPPAPPAAYRARAMLIGAMLAIGLLGGRASAEEPTDVPIPPHLSAMSDAEIDARLDYLIQHLDDRRLYAEAWWTGWTSFYALGIVVQSTRAGLEDDAGKKADLIISAVKATAGTINLLRHPLASKWGADGVRQLPNATREDKLARLAVAESTLQKNAEAADRRYSWVSHLLNVGINAAGGAIVDGVYDDTTRAWRSAGIGIAVGELMLWSHPWWYRDDWDNYQRRFSPVATEPRVSWQVVPTFGGVALHARF